MCILKFSCTVIGRLWHSISLVYQSENNKDFYRLGIYRMVVLKGRNYLLLFLFLKIGNKIGLQYRYACNILMHNTKPPRQRVLIKGVCYTIFISFAIKWTTLLSCKWEWISVCISMRGGLAANSITSIRYSNTLLAGWKFHIDKINNRIKLLLAALYCTVCKYFMFIYNAMSNFCTTGI